MADPRKSIAIALEKGPFGSGRSTITNTQGKDVFFALPPGAWNSHSNEYKTESIFASGSKLREAAAYGPFSGSGSMHFLMDYDHTEFLDVIFDKHQIGHVDSNGDIIDDGQAVPNVSTDDGDAVYDHFWEKDNSTFIKPFVIREKILNRIANTANSNALDEVVILKGCVVKGVEFNRSQQGSQMEVKVSYIFADMEVQLAELTVTDYTPYISPVGPTQYSCMFMDGEAKDNYVRDVDSHAIKLDMDTSLVYNTCTPFATAYFEGQSHISWDAKTFMNDPLKKFQLRPFSGGKDANHLKPMSKGLMPMEKVFFTTYNLSMRDEDGIEQITDAIAASPYIVKFELVDSTVNAMSWPDGEGEKMTDALQSVECSKVRLMVRNTHSTTAWTNKIAGNNGAGQDYVPVPLGMVTAKIRPQVISEDEDLGGDTGSPMTISMADGEFILATSNDLERGKIYYTDSLETIEGWFPIPYNTPIYKPATGGAQDLMTLLNLTSTEAENLTNTGLTLTPDWQIVEEVVTSEGSEVGDPTIIKYVPVTSISGTLTSTAGVYKYYIVKGHIVPDGANKVLVIEDRGILRIDVPTGN